MATSLEKRAERERVKAEKNAEKRYYEEAGMWDAEVFRTARGQRRVLWWLNGVSWTITLLMALALMLMMPLKTVEPYVIEVDRASGLVEVKRPIYEGGITQNEAITKYFIVQYLTAREAYLYDRAAEDYTKVQKMSSLQVASRYATDFAPGNPSSPLNIYGRSGTVEIRIRNVSFITENTVTIPIKRIGTTKGRVIEDYEVVTLTFQYLNDPASEADRFINPLGFQVTAYRKDPQLLNED